MAEANLGETTLNNVPLTLCRNTRVKGFFISTIKTADQYCYPMRETVMFQSLSESSTQMVVSVTMTRASLKTDHRLPKGLVFE